MATILDTNPTLIDVSKRLDPNGRIPLIAEMQTRINEFLADMPMLEANDQAGHTGVIRTDIPTAAWRILNYGTLPSKSRTKQVTDTCGMVETFSEIDEEIYELNGSRDEFRMSEDTAHIEGVGQTLSAAICYGNQQTDPEQITGLMPRYSDLSAENGGQIIDAEGVDGSDNASILLIAWGERTIHGFYPKGSQAGLQFKDLGVETKTFSDGRLMRVLRSQIKQKIGIHLKDSQSVVRIANIDVSDLAGAGASGYAGADLVMLLVDAWARIPLRLRKTAARMAFYCPPVVKTALVKIAMFDKANNTLTLEQMERGEPMLRFWGIPIRECDAMLTTEAPVT